MISFYKKNNLNFLTNNKPRYIPHGFDCEIMSSSLLGLCYKKASTEYEKEHVTPWIYKNNFSKKNNIKLLKKNYSNIRITLDTPNDYIKFIENEKILKNVATKKNFVFYLNKGKL